LEKGLCREPRIVHYKGDKTNKFSPTKLGFEIEIEHTKSDSAVKIVKALYKDFDYSIGFLKDGSLDNGTEIITPPVSGAAIKTMIETICSKIKPYAKTSPNCGLHIHADTSQFKKSTFSKLIRLMYVFERVFYFTNPSSRLTPNQRTGKFYCKPLETNYDFRLLRENKKEELDKLIFTEDDRNIIERRGTQHYDNARYFGVNFHSWFRHKTIEFRYFKGEKDAYPILAWAQIIQAIIDKAIKGFKESELRLLYGKPFNELLQAFFVWFDLSKPLRNFLIKRADTFMGISEIHFKALVNTFRRNNLRAKTQLLSNLEEVEANFTKVQALKKDTEILRDSYIGMIKKGYEPKKINFSSSLKIFKQFSQNRPSARYRLLKTELKKRKSIIKLFI